MNKRNTLLPVALTLTILSHTSFAEEHKKNKRKGPPTVAIEACINTSEGATCEFIGRHGKTRQGICLVISKKKESTQITSQQSEEFLACKPNRHDARINNKNR